MTKEILVLCFLSFPAETMKLPAVNSGASKKKTGIFKSTYCLSIKVSGNFITTGFGRYSISLEDVLRKSCSKTSKPPPAYSEGNLHHCPVM